MNAEKFPPRFTHLLLESHIHKFAARPFWPFDIHRLAPKHSASEQKREHGEALLLRVAVSDANDGDGSIGKKWVRQFRRSV